MHKKALVTAVIATILVFLDGIITQFIGENTSFVWIAFISWTVFASDTPDERIRAVPGYIVGFLMALAILGLGKLLSSFIALKILGVAVASIIATGIINWICVYFEKLDKLYLNSIKGIFVGISLTLSGLGIGLKVNSLQSLIQMISIIILYSVLGLLAGYFCNKKI